MLLMGGGVLDGWGIWGVGWGGFGRNGLDWIGRWKFNIILCTHVIE